MTTKGRWSRVAAVCLALILLPAIVQSSPPADKKKPGEGVQKKSEKSYSLIFGTAYGPDDRPMYGVKITIRSEGKKHSTWELLSDHRGEFAQRVPPGPTDYLVKGEAEYAPVGEDGKPHMSKKTKLKGETRVHIEGQERQDIGVHLQ